MTTANYSTGNDRFDSEAATWDTKLLEIGCGTGLLTIPLAQHVGNIVALDTAQGMIGMLNAKIAQHGLEDKVKAEVKLLESADDAVLAGERFDVVVSHLVFHHVPHMSELIKVIKGTLKRGGRIWISDLQDDGPQAEAFHPKDKHAGVERHGLKRTEMHQILVQAGFDNVEVFESFRMDKTVESGVVQAFPFLAITGVRP
ncbi:hypothetical protein [Sporisorium scitamineum]|uniref:Methyltransferase type 11 domain-containing protein n=1 Tax=Sporisorium scitamineum TaxID=49012 RepID=A0A0F7SCK3_9BASI|nr:hypothetical protein [Sporisorium scitamineum]